VTSPDLAACKEKLRSELLQSRRAVSGADADRAARRVAEYVAALPTFQAADAVALYASLPDELPTRPLFDAVHASGKAVLLPRFDGDSLVFAQAEHWDDLRRGRYGVAEPPVGAAAVRPRSLVVLPGVAFDREGNRLGRGGGHYDRAFADTPVGQPMLVGVGWDFQRVDRVPHGPADRRLDAVVTEAGVFEAGETT
jgi:5-formyltetrahydrofolate cyclo-ligase